MFVSVHYQRLTMFDVAVDPAFVEPQDSRMDSAGGASCCYTGGLFVKVVGTGKRAFCNEETSCISAYSYLAM